MIESHAEINNHKTRSDQSYIHIIKIYGPVHSDVLLTNYLTQLKFYLSREGGYCFMLSSGVISFSNLEAFPFYYEPANKDSKTMARSLSSMGKKPVAEGRMPHDHTTHGAIYPHSQRWSPQNH